MNTLVYRICVCAPEVMELAEAIILVMYVVSVDDR